MPHDLLAEKSLIGCLLIDGSSFDEISDVGLSKDDFYHPQFAQIYQVVKDLYSNSKPIDFITVCSRLSDLNLLGSMGEGEHKGKDYVLGLIEDQVTAVHVYHYANIVKEKAVLRTVIKMGQKITETGLSFSGNPNDFLSEIESDFYKLTAKSRVEKLQNLGACLKENLRHLAEEGGNDGRLNYPETGFNFLDEKLMGLRPGQLILVAARPGMGKTAFGLNLGLNSVKKLGRPIVIFSLEMLAHELSMRILSSESKVSATKLRSKDFSEADLRSIARTVQRLSSLPIYINDNGDTTIYNVLSECRKLKMEQGIGLIVVDYVQLMKSHTGNPSREQQIAEISRGLKQIAKELECPVIALSQLNRAVETRTNKRPMVADLRESGALEQDADVVLLLYRDDFYNEDSKDKGIAEVIIGKNRAGETGSVKLSWVGAYTSFENLSLYEKEDDEFLMV